MRRPSDHGHPGKEEWSDIKECQERDDWELIAGAWTTGDVV